MTRKQNVCTQKEITVAVWALQKRVNVRECERV